VYLSRAVLPLLKATAESVKRPVRPSLDSSVSESILIVGANKGPKTGLTQSSKKFQNVPHKVYDVAVKSIKEISGRV